LLRSNKGALKNNNKMKTELKRNKKAETGTLFGTLPTVQ